MAWVKLDDGFPEHPKVERAGDKAAWLYVCGLAYCSRTLSDGYIPESRLCRLTRLPQPRRLAEKLVEVGLWDRLPDGWLVHDYGRHQRTKDQVEAVRAANAARAQRFREQRSA